MRSHFLVVLVGVLSGCTGGASPGDTGTNPDDRADDPEAHAQPAAGLGTGDHSLSSINLHLLVKASRLNGPMAMAFATDAPKDLWIVNELDDSWTIVDGVGTTSQRTRRFYDDSDHFLNNPTALSFASEDEHAVATCNENLNDYNGLAAPDGFMGPVAWTTDRSRFSGGQMSHYDMAHEEPLCMGIAWEQAHVWWTFNGYDDSLDRVDFHGWHPDTWDHLGGHDHTDGEIFRYFAGEMKRVEGVPSQMVVDPATGMLYVNDTGNHRIVRFDTTEEPSCTELLGRFGEMVAWQCDGELEEIVPAGTVEQPSGLALHGGLLYVTDHADGRVLAFTTDGTLVNWVDTGRGDNALTGVAVSPEGVVYILDKAVERVYRIDPVVTE